MTTQREIQLQSIVMFFGLSILALFLYIGPITNYTLVALNPNIIMVYVILSFLAILCAFSANLSKKYCRMMGILLLAWSLANYFAWRYYNYHVLKLNFYNAEFALILLYLGCFFVKKKATS